MKSELRLYRRGTFRLAVQLGNLKKWCVFLMREITAERVREIRNQLGELLSAYYAAVQDTRLPGSLKELVDRLARRIEEHPSKVEPQSS